MLRAFRFVGFTLLALSLSSCGSFKPYQESNPTCAGLKRKIIFYSHDPNHPAEWASPTYRAKLMQDYKRYGCDQENADQQPNNVDKPTQTSNTTK